MDKLEKYWMTYDSGTSDTSDFFHNDTTVYGYTCPRCGCWVSGGEYHSCYYCPTVWTNYWPSPNKTEQAFKILKALVESKVIREPTSFKKFCDLIEKIAGII